MAHAATDYREQGCFFCSGINDRTLTLLWHLLFPTATPKNSLDGKPLKRTKNCVIDAEVQPFPVNGVWPGCGWGRTVSPKGPPARILAVFHVPVSIWATQVELSKNFFPFFFFCFGGGHKGGGGVDLGGLGSVIVKFPNN